MPTIPDLRQGNEDPPHIEEITATKPEHSHMTRFYQIDLFRFLAATMVMLFHYGFRGAHGEAPHRLDVSYPNIAGAAKYGYLGVELFFMISGFVILLSVQDGNLYRFAKSRFLRLFPAFWFACSLTHVASMYGMTPSQPLTTEQYLVNMTMLAGSSNFFSVAADGRPVLRLPGFLSGLRWN